MASSTDIFASQYRRDLAYPQTYAEPQGGPVFFANTSGAKIKLTKGKQPLLTRNVPSEVVSKKGNVVSVVVKKKKKV